MAKKFLTALIAVIMITSCVTSISAASKCPNCGGSFTTIGCGFSSLDDCELDELTCPDHSNCIKQYYYADSRQRCNSCSRVYVGVNTHYHAEGHRRPNAAYSYSMELVCAWW